MTTNDRTRLDVILTLAFERDLRVIYQIIVVENVGLQRNQDVSACALMYLWWR
jgi:hypothetical protein